MQNLLFVKWIKNVSLTRKLYFVVGIMAVLIAVELFTLSFMIHTLSSTRALVSGESLWSKAEKDAVYSLTQYGYTRNEKSYEQYQNLLDVPLGDHKARIELLKPEPVHNIVFQGFLEGKINPDDIDGIISLLRRFHNISYIKKAIAVWAEADGNIAQLQYLGNRLHTQINAINPNPAEINQTLDQIYMLNSNLTILEDEFSFTLGEGSRWVEQVVLEILFIIAITVEFSGLFLTISVSRAISKGINEIVDVSKAVSKGNFGTRAQIFSQDEIGQLAGSFNRMIDDLQRKIIEEKDARQALDIQQHLYETLVNAQSEMGEGVCITEEERIVYVNDALCEMYGYSREELLKLHSFFDLVPDHHKETLVERSKERIAGHRDQTSGETKIIRKDGKVIDIDYSVRNLRDNNVTRTISIIRDVTEKKLAERLLHAEKERAERAEIARKIGEQFLANMSHEIRTPMNAIIGFTDILQNTPLTEEQERYLDAIKTSGDNLLVIINDILDFSRIRSGKLPIEKHDFSLSHIVDTCRELMLPKAREKKLNLTTIVDKRIPDALVGDSTRLMQVLLNLTSNAIKFTAKGEVRLAVHMLANENEMVQLSFEVSDTGIGIPQEQLDTIFDAFTQVNGDTARKYGGTGLGLAIVKQLADLQGGSITVSSEEGKGSSFVYTIDYAISKNKLVEKPDDTTKEIKATIKDLHVLLAEDNTMNQMLAKKVLNDWGWEVDIAENGEEAIELLQKKDFDVILMDILLPKMNGYEATKYIRDKLAKPKSDIPIIAMTAYAMQGEQEKCLRAGMNGYVSKPFNTSTLYNKISRVLKSS